MKKLIEVKELKEKKDSPKKYKGINKVKELLKKRKDSSKKYKEINEIKKLLKNKKDCPKKNTDTNIKELLKKKKDCLKKNNEGNLPIKNPLMKSVDNIIHNDMTSAYNVATKDAALPTNPSPINLFSVSEDEPIACSSHMGTISTSEYGSKNDENLSDTLSSIEKISAVETLLQAFSSKKN